MELAEEIAKFVLGLTLTDDLPAICVAAIESGLDSPSLRLLASDIVGPRIDLSERREVFHRALAELGIAVPIPHEAAMTIATQYARRVLERTLTAYEGASHLWNLCRLDGYAGELLPFVGLASAYEEDEDEEHRDDYARQIIERCRILVEGGAPPLGHSARGSRPRG